jgi:hypothetical protein
MVSIRKYLFGKYLFGILTYVCIYITYQMIVCLMFVCSESRLWGVGGSKRPLNYTSKISDRNLYIHKLEN